MFPSSDFFAGETRSIPNAATFLEASSSGDHRTRGQPKKRTRMGRRSTYSYKLGRCALTGHPPVDQPPCTRKLVPCSSSGLRPHTTCQRYHSEKLKMTYPNGLFSAFAFIGFLMCAIPFPWHLEGNWLHLPEPRRSHLTLML